MSFPGVGDIVKGIELATRIYECESTYENRADVQYANFQNQVLEFKELLDKLNIALQEAQQRWEKKAPSGIKPLERDLEQERKTIVGDFYKTLRECDAMLQKNRQFRERDSNVVENLRYNLSQQEVKADVLRRRLHFHSLKIRLVIDRLSVNILTDLDDKVDDILAITEQNLQVSKDIRLELARFYTSWLGYVSGQGAIEDVVTEDQFTISPALIHKFEQSMRGDEDSCAPLDVPLVQGFDALLEHFEESREEGSSQTHRGYLLFLKSRWLLERILESSDYKDARPGYYYKRAVNQVHQAILTRMAKPTRLIAFPDDVLLQLPESDYAVWSSQGSLEEVEYRKPDPIMVRGGEEKLCAMELASTSPQETESLTAIKSSEQRMRIVHERSSKLPKGRVVVTQHEMIVTEDRLIPRYAFPTLVEPCLELAIFCRNAEYFDFRSIEDVHKFQAALMGFQVSHEQMNVRCQFSDEDMICKGPGRVQLWQEPIKLQQGSAEHDDPPGGPGRHHSHAHRSSFTSGSLKSSIAATSTVQAVGEGTARIVIYTQLLERTKRAKEKKKFAAIAVDLDSDIYVDTTSCPCHRDPTCTIVALRARKSSRSSFNAAFVTSETDDEGQPDPITFNILPLRTPSGSRLRPKIAIKRTEYLMLVFSGLASRSLFIEELNLRFAVRDQQMRDRKTFEQSMRHLQDHPVASQQYAVRRNRPAAVPTWQTSKQLRSSSFTSDVSNTRPEDGSAIAAVSSSFSAYPGQERLDHSKLSHSERSDSGYESWRTDATRTPSTTSSVARLFGRMSSKVIKS